jgi:pilus assembly protein CpaE
MSSGLALQSDPARVLACTVSKNVHLFDLLIEDMEAELGEAWGDLTFDEARAFLDQPDAEDLEFLAIAVTADDELDLGMVGELIVAAKAHGVRSILVAHDLGPAALHDLLRLGADDFVPYPLAEGALQDAIARIRAAKPVPAVSALDTHNQGDGARPDAPAPVEIGQRMGGQAAVFAVQGLAGGTGASTLAVNLAWELANIDKQKSPSVCLLDFDLQAGTVSTFLDLPRRDMVIELLQDARTMDVDAFKQALLGYEGKLSVFPAPPELLPLDLIGPEEVDALLGFATQCFDIVVVDMPHTLVMWTETVLNRAARIVVSTARTARPEQELYDEVTGLGPLETLLKDDTVNDILVNGPQQIFVERAGKLELSRRHLQGRKAPAADHRQDRVGRGPPRRRIQPLCRRPSARRLAFQRDGAAGGRRRLAGLDP